MYTFVPIVGRRDGGSGTSLGTRLYVCYSCRSRATEVVRYGAGAVLSVKYGFAAIAANAVNPELCRIQSYGALPCESK